MNYIFYLELSSFLLASFLFYMHRWMKGLSKPTEDGNNAFKITRCLGKKDGVLFGIILVFNFYIFLINCCNGVRICLCESGPLTGALSILQMKHK
jgi:hypothetical protein